MRRLFVLAALICGFALYPATSFAGRSSIKMVDVSIEMRLLDLNGQPLSMPDGAHLVISCFGRTPWQPQHWAHVRGWPDSTGDIQCVAKFPVDVDFLKRLTEAVGSRKEADVTMEVQVLDGHDRPVSLPNGLRVEIYRLGANPWPVGRVAVIYGQPDSIGRLKSKVNLPIDTITFLNFSLLMTLGRGK